MKFPAILTRQGSVIRALGFLVVWPLLNGTANAELIDGSSMVSIDTSFGVSSWYVEGQNQGQEAFGYSLGGGPEAAIGTIGLTGSQLNGAVLTTTYANSQLGITISYLLSGGAPGSGVSGLQEQVLIQNLTQSTLHFFDLASFAPGGVGNNPVQLFKSISGLTGEAVVNPDGPATADSTFTPASASTSGGAWTADWSVGAGRTTTLSINNDITGVTPLTIPDATSSSFLLCLSLAACGLVRRCLH